MPPSEGRTTAVPRVFMIVTIALLLARIGVLVYEKTNPAAESSFIKWTDPAHLPEKTDHKLYLLWFTADWCGPCKVLEQSAFRNKDAVNLINEYFVPIKITDRKKEDGKNSNDVQVLEGKFHLVIFPTLVVTLPNTDMDTVDTQIGGGSTRATVDFLNRALKNAPFKIGLHELADGKTDQAIATLSQWLSSCSWTDSRSVLTSLYISAAYVNKNDLTKARQVLQEAKDQARTKAWPAELLSYLDQPKEKIIDLAEEDHTQLLDAHYFAGILLLSKGDTKGAETEFGWVKQHGTKGQYAWASAINQLNQLDKTKTLTQP